MTFAIPWHLLPAVGERVALELIAALSGAFAALIVVRLFFAPIFRVGTLTTPSCRFCRAGLRGEGEDISRRCPECGRELSADRDVRWMTPGWPRWVRAAVCLGALTLGVKAGGRVALALSEDWRQSSPRSKAGLSDNLLDRMLAFPAIAPRMPDRFDVSASLREGFLDSWSQPHEFLPPEAAMRLTSERADAIGAARAAGRPVDPRDEEWARRLTLLSLNPTDEVCLQRAVDILRRVHTPVLSMNTRLVRGNEVRILLDGVSEGRPGVVVVEELTACRWGADAELIDVRRSFRSTAHLKLPATIPLGAQVIELRWQSILFTLSSRDGIVLAEHVERVPVLVVDRPENKRERDGGRSVAKTLAGALPIVDLAEERPALGDMGAGTPRLLVGVELVIPRRPFAVTLRPPGEWSLVVGDAEVPLKSSDMGGAPPVVRGPMRRWLKAGLFGPHLDRDWGIGAGDHVAWEVALPLATAADRKRADLLRAGQAAVRYRESPQAPESQPEPASVHDIPITLRGSNEVVPAAWYPGSHDAWANQDMKWPSPPKSDVNPNRYARLSAWLSW